jgi:hypothetical protein
MIAIGHHSIYGVPSAAGVRFPLPCEQSPLVFLLGTARRSERDSAELVYILCGADNPKTWIIMSNFRFDTSFITGFITTYFITTY